MGILDFIDNAARGLLGERKMVSPVPDEVLRQGNPKPQRKPKPKEEELTPERIAKGVRRWRSDAPLANNAKELYEATKRLKGTKVDPWMPVVMAIMETGGGSKYAANNNLYNLKGIQGGVSKFVEYPSPAVSIIGGDNNGQPAKGFVGTMLEHPSYEAYRKTGRLEDFFPSYTPPGAEHGNPELPELIERYNKVRQTIVDAPTLPTLPTKPMDKNRKKKLEELAR